MAEAQPTSVRRSPGRIATVLTALLAGVAGGLMAPLILPRLERNIRPATKRILKTGISLYEGARERAAEFSEIAGDMLAEARAEYDAGESSGGAAADSAATNEVVSLRRGAGKEAGLPNG